MTQELKKTGCPAWVKIVLIASLGLNIAGLGVLAGHGMKDREGGANRQVDWIIRLVPDERRDFAKAHFESRRDDMRKARRDRIALMNRITEVIRQEPFLPEELNSALQARRAASEARKRIVHDGLVSMLAEFNAAERATFTTRLEEQLARAQKRWQSR